MTEGHRSNPLRSLRSAPRLSGTERVLRLDAPDGTALAIVVIDSTRRGPAFGGVRRARYLDFDAALADAHGLARAMTLKCALAELPAGGAKAVILDRPGLALADTYRRLGALVESLGGDYVCGPDIGTGREELDWLRQSTGWVNPARNDASASTARGVLGGVRATLRVANGDASLAGRSVLVQGLGGVGTQLSSALLAEGARVLGLDVDRVAQQRASALGLELLDAEQAIDWPDVACDLFAPCALGGVLTPVVASRLGARAVCGSANNVLGDPEVGRALHERGVLVAPDIVVTAGAVIEGVLTTVAGESPATRARVESAIEGIEARCEGLLRESLAHGVAPGELAERRASRVLLG